jgi:hypothetical protein
LTSVKQHIRRRARSGRRHAARPGLGHNICSAYRSRVRGCLDSQDEEKVGFAIGHICAVADAGLPVLDDLLREAHGVSYKWEEWKKRDRWQAELMEWYLFSVAEEAKGERDWQRALNKAKRMTAEHKELYLQARTERER